MLRHLIITLTLVLALNFTANQITPSANTQPYIYYYSNVEHALVVERADGTDSRLLGEGLMPPNHNVISGLDWSVSGEWIAWMSSYPSDSGATFTKNIWVMRTDGSQRLTVLDNLGGTFQMLKWSPKQDNLMVIFTKNATLSYLIVDPAADKIIARADYQGRPIQYMEFYNGYWLDRGDMIYFMFALGDTQLLGFLSVENQTTTRIFQAFTNSIMGLQNGRLFRRDYNAATNQTDLIVEDLNDGKIMTLIQNASDKSIFSLNWSPKFDRALLTEDQCPRNISCQTGHPNHLSLVNWNENTITFIGNDFYLPNMVPSWSPDSNFVVLQTTNQQTVILNTISVQIHPAPAAAALFSWQWLSKDNTALYASGTYQSVSYFMLNVETGVTQPFSFPISYTGSFLVPLNNLPTGIIVSPNGRFLGTRENNGMNYKIYDREQNKTLPWLNHSFAERGGLFTDYLWQPDNYWYMTGQRISFAGGGGGPEAVMILNVDGTVRRELGVCFAFPTCAGFVPDRVLPYLAKGSATSVVQQPLATLSFQPPVAFAWSPDSTKVATYNFHYSDDLSPSLKIWDITTNPPVLIKEIAAEDVWSRQEDYVGCYAIWNTDGQTISVFSQATYKTWNTESGALIDSGKIPVEQSPNRQYQWSKTNDTVTISDVKSNRELNHFAFQGDANTLRWSLDGLILFAQLKDKSLILWDSSRNSVVQFPTVANYGLEYLTASVRYLVAGNRYDIAHVWDITTQQPLKDLNFYPTTARFSPDGKLLAAVTASQITIWNTADFK
jgi:hypothetical protein